ncbi:unnamed protein product [Zymoseptoria tritici ST99CH_1A5]|uniref:Zn(2)-C6 fungal-type domain-containing protein n=1 Tax=Zymoseptoria tritici ST99CH_1A5 TaxID=1276529 RepID=A0A1Y6L5Q6_ZYMTR|nr:unnamed protein product [Zymoseptoria tritici ST99CH_1A5]
MLIRRGKEEGWLNWSLEATHQWARSSGIKFTNATPAIVPGRGIGLLADHDLSSPPSSQMPLEVLAIAEDLVLSLETIKQHALFDRDFREVLESLGQFGATPRGAILTFLLFNATISCPHLSEKVGVHSAFTDYVKTLPCEHLPTFWTPDELSLLAGTTLAPAISAKLKSLRREYDLLCSSTGTRWYKIVQQHISFDDWLQVDAFFRSRALDFHGSCMIPGMDLASHAAGEDTNTFYDRQDGNYILWLMKGKEVKKGQEITISYGDEKGACEMLFSYGFIDQDMESAETLFLSLAIPDEDPSKISKIKFADCAPGFKIIDTSDQPAVGSETHESRSGDIDWTGDFIWLLCVGHEDGFQLQLARTVDGAEEVEATFQGETLSDARDLRRKLSQSSLWDVYRLRAVVILQQRVYDQLQVLYGTQEGIESLPRGDTTNIGEPQYELATKLRRLEFGLLETAYEDFERQKLELAESAVVKDYLAADLSSNGPQLQLYRLRLTNDISRELIALLRKSDLYAKVLDRSALSQSAYLQYAAECDGRRGPAKGLEPERTPPSYRSQDIFSHPANMPGILPMKVIKVGTNAQSRIAQACDRCRSKKIRCDGIRPCCSQCSNVGFECKTSDKLSRRAFPRGYTESLEERVRVLETEVRELKDLLDEKDEKIDMLSRISPNSAHSIQITSSRRQSTPSEKSAVRATESPPKDDVFNVQQSPYLLDDAGADSYFTGTSSGRTFIEAFKNRVQEDGRSASEINTGALLAGVPKTPESTNAASTPVTFKAPPRLVSDQLINIFFQEWAPLYPVLHRPTFLTLYGRYVADCDAVTDRSELAQLNLVFGIAALSSGSRASGDLESFETQWKAALDSIITDSSMSTLQALILAQIFCVQQGDLTRLLTYKGLSFSLSARLGLHQSQKRFALGTLTCETRKKVFWTLYTVDCFTAVVLGLPRQLKDDDISCEFPVDADDEYVTDRGFQPTLPGESTKLSSALALFRASQILSKVLEEVYPAKTSYELSFRKLSELSDELDAWSTALPPHLRLQFTQDKPSTGTISSRSPLLSLTYHYIRALIHRPAICASLGSRSSSSMIALGNSCKHMIQIVQLLDERCLSFTFCLNRDETLVLAGFGLLFQGLGLDAGSKMLKDNNKMISSAVQVLNKTEAPCVAEFERVATFFIGVPTQTAPLPPPAVKPKAKIPALSRHNSDGGSTTQSTSLPSSTRKQLKAIASRFTATATSKPGKLDAPDGGRRATAHTICLHPSNVLTQSQPALLPAIARSEPARSPANMYSRPTSTAAPRPSAPPPQLKPKPRSLPQAVSNLDYLSFGNEPDAASEPVKSQNVQPIKTEPAPTDWEKLLGSLDNGQTNIFDACYGGPPVDALDTPPMSLPNTIPLATLVDNSIAWNADLWALCPTETNTSASSGPSSGTGQAASVLSFSTDEGLSSSEDFAADWTNASSHNDGFMIMPNGDDFWQ